MLRGWAECSREENLACVCVGVSVCVGSPYCGKQIQAGLMCQYRRWWPLFEKNNNKKCWINWQGDFCMINSFCVATERLYETS